MVVPSSLMRIGGPRAGATHRTASRAPARIEADAAVARALTGPVLPAPHERPAKGAVGGELQEAGRVEAFGSAVEDLVVALLRVVVGITFIWAGAEP